MKYFVALCIALFAVTASAQHHHYRGPGLRYDGAGWVFPIIVGGVIGYEISRNQQQQQPAPVIVQQPPVIIQQAPVVVDPGIVYINGIAYRKQYMNINGVWQEVLVR